MVVSGSDVTSQGNLLQLSSLEIAKLQQLPALSERPNLLLIVLDTMRLDSAADLSDALRDFVSYQNAVSAAPWTLPSHVSLLSGLYPSKHGCHEDVNVKCDDVSKMRTWSPLVVKVLKQLGYRIYGYSANILISSAYGFEGFDLLENSKLYSPWPEILDNLGQMEARSFRKLLATRKPLDGIGFILRVFFTNPTKAVTLLSLFVRLVVNRAKSNWPREKGADQALGFIKKTGLREPFFLFMNLLEFHEPYFKSDDLLNGLTPRSVDSIEPAILKRWIKGYHSQARYAKGKLILLLKELGKKGLLEKTVVIVTSDHGQLLGEHGWIGHGSFLYDELIRVPLMIRYPPGLGVELEQPHGVISLTNIPGFLLDLARGKRTDSHLYGSEAFAQSWGLYESVSAKKRSIFKKYSSELAKQRVCVYESDSKLTYNVTDGLVEEYLNSGVADSMSKDRLVQMCIRMSTSKNVMGGTSQIAAEDEAGILQQLRRMGYV